MDWISVSDSYPPSKQKVEVKHQDGYNIVWKSYGYWRDGFFKVWSIKYCEGLKRQNSKPTHWRPM